jgi:hypothetical protein
MYVYKKKQVARKRVKRQNATLMERKTTREKSSQLTVLSLQEFLNLVKKFPRARGVIKYPVFIT